MFITDNFNETDDAPEKMPKNMMLASIASEIRSVLSAAELEPTDESDTQLFNAFKRLGERSMAPILEKIEAERVSSQAIEHRLQECLDAMKALRCKAEAIEKGFDDLYPIVDGISRSLAENQKIMDLTSHNSKLIHEAAEKKRAEYHATQT